MIPDRTDAIRTALIMAHPTDVLLFAGKGAESVMITQAGPIPWSDKGVIERILMEIEAQVMVV
jgi:UDP-N-acetylmuramyl tripeptide synthase